MYKLRYRNAWLAIGWALVALVVYLSVGDVSVTPRDVAGADKVGHVLAYFTMMLWFMEIVAERRTRLWIGCALLLLGIAMEFVQAGLPNRSFELMDMAADAVGVLIGWIAAPGDTSRLMRVEDLLTRRES